MKEREFTVNNSKLVSKKISKCKKNVVFKCLKEWTVL